MGNLGTNINLQNNELYSGLSNSIKIDTNTFTYNSSNFIYQITGNIDDKMMNEINEIPNPAKYKNRVNKIFELGNKLKFIHTESYVFYNNLALIDSYLPNILSEMIICYYKDNIKNLSKICNYLNKANPCAYDLQCNHPYYDYKVKRFLVDIASGMVSNTVWTGKYDVTGGIIIVKKNGDLVCYHIYNKNDFENYLLKNTIFDTPSGSRHNFGKIYKKDEKYYINLNFQIRFIN